MSLINSTRDVSRIGIKEGMRYRAIVTSNDDKNKKGKKSYLGRIKFKIPKFFEFEISDCPWAIPQSNGADGASKICGTVNVPRVGSYVDIMFMGGSVYHPTYHSTSIFESIVTELGKINYPNRKVTVLANGTHIIIDEEANSMEFYVPGDYGVKANGTCNLSIAGNVIINSKAGRVNLTTENGDVLIKSKGGNMTLNTSADAVVNADGAVNVTAGGNINLKSSKGGRLGGVVTGNHNCMVTGKPHNACSTTVFST
jgi:hypothetical protein